MTLLFVLMIIEGHLKFGAMPMPSMQECEARIEVVKRDAPPYATVMCVYVKKEGDRET